MYALIDPLGRQDRGYRVTQRVEAPDPGPLLVSSHRSFKVIGRLINGHWPAILGDRVLPPWVVVEPGGHHSGEPWMNVDFTGGEGQSLVPLFLLNRDAPVFQVPVVQQGPSHLRPATTRQSYE